MVNLKSTIYYLSGSERILNDRFLKKQSEASGVSLDIYQKCITMLYSFLNMLMEDELKMIGRSDTLNSLEIQEDGQSIFYNIMKGAEAIYEKVKREDYDESFCDELSSDIISLRFNYLSLKSAHPHLF